LGKKHLTIKELPSGERPYEKFLKNGAEFLSDAELLAIILRTGTHGERVTEIAHRVLCFGDGKGLYEILELDYEELMLIKGIGKAKAIQLKAIAEIHRRLLKYKAKEKIYIRKPESIAKYFSGEMENLKNETFRALLLDTKLGIISDELIGTGIIDRLLITPREVFKQAILKCAKSMVLVHNHPSGVAKPSSNDLELTKRLIVCGRILDIKIEDHVIIGKDEYYSIRENGDVQFIEEEV